MWEPKSDERRLFHLPKTVHLTCWIYKLKLKITYKIQNASLGNHYQTILTLDFPFLAIH